MRETPVERSLKLGYRAYSGQAVPNLDQSGDRPVCRQLRQSLLVAESLRVRHCFGYRHRSVHHDVVRFVFNRVNLHFCSPCRVITAVRTFIDPFAGTSKRNLIYSGQIVGAGLIADGIRL
jgi:hypothetical protein